MPSAQRKDIAKSTKALGRQINGLAERTDCEAGQECRFKLAVSEPFDSRALLPHHSEPDQHSIRSPDSPVA
jgi:hypothetical protein